MNCSFLEWWHYEPRVLGKRTGGGGRTRGAEKGVSGKQKDSRLGLPPGVGGLRFRHHGTVRGTLDANGGGGEGRIWLHRSLCRRVPVALGRKGSMAAGRPPAPPAGCGA